MHIKNDYLWGFLWLAVITAAFFAPVIIGRQSLFEAYPVLYEKKNLIPPQIKTPWTIDGATHVRTVAPHTMFGVAELRKGRLPLWGPYDGAGEAPMSNNSYLWNPIRALYFSASTNLHAFDLYFVLRFLIAGFGMFVFLKEWLQSRRAALFGAVSYAFSGYFFIYLTYPFLDIDAYVPWVLFALERALRSGALRRFVVAGLLLSLFLLGGHPQVALVSGLFVGAYAVGRTLANREKRAKILPWFGKLILVPAVALAVAAPYVADLVSNYRQGYTIYDPHVFESQKMPHGLEHARPEYLAHLLVNPSTMLEVAIGGHLYETFTAIVPYVSLLVILLALAGLALPRKPYPVVFFYIFALFALLKVFGFPLVNWIGALPILEKIGWHKIYAALALSLSGIAAFTYETWGLEKPNLKRIGLIWGSVAVALAAAWIFAAPALMKSYVPNLDFLNRRPETVALVTSFVEKLPGPIEPFVLRALHDGRIFTLLLFIRTGIYLALALLLLIWLAKTGSKKAHIALLIFLVLELLSYPPKVRDGFRYFNPYATPPFVSFLEARAKEDRFAVMATDYTFPVSLGTRLGIRRFQTTSAIFPQRFWHFVPDTIRKNDNDYFKLRHEDVPETPRQFFDMANIKYLVTEAPETKVPEDFKKAYDGDLLIYENETVLPRAYLAFRGVRAASPEEARKLVYAPDFDPHRTVVVEEAETATLFDASARPQNAAPTHIELLEPRELIIRTTADARSLLVVADVFFNGWRATVDGIPAPIYPVNVMFRGIPVPAGEHTVRMFYKPNWLMPSLLVSITTFLGSIICLLITRRKANDELT